jgi:HEAT repeat protein
MSFFGKLFGREEEPQDTGARKISPQIVRLTKKLENQWGQSQDRQIAIDALAALATPEAVDALLKRFNFRIEQTIGDEQEKRMVFDHLVALGPVSVESILSFLRTENSPYWPTKALRQIAGDDATVDYLLEIINGMEAIFDRDIQRKIELVSNLREFNQPKVTEALLLFARDENEELRVHAVEGLAATGCEDMCDVLIDRLVDPEETQRMRTAILSLLVDKKWKVKARKDEIRQIIPESFWIDDVGTIKAR